jgi:hypothetical protein
MSACLDGWLKKYECFFRPEFNELSGYRRVLDASGDVFLCGFSHNRAAGIKARLRLHTAKLVVEPCLAFVVYHALVKEYAIQNTEIVFKVSEMINLYPLKFVLKVIKAFFKGGVQHGLLETVFDEIYPMPSKAYDKNNGRRYSGNQEEGQRHGGKAIYNIVQNIPAGHIFNIKPYRG